jgi:hypothetical protein
VATTIELLQQEQVKRQNEFISSRALNEQRYTEWMTRMNNLEQRYRNELLFVDFNKTFKDWFPSLFKATAPTPEEYALDKEAFTAFTLAVHKVREKWLVEAEAVLKNEG